MVAAGHQYQLSHRLAGAEARRPLLTSAVFTPGPLLGHQADPELLHLRQQHHAQHGLAVVGQRKMHRVFAGALQKILGAIQRIENPQPLGIERLTGRELLLGGLLAQQRPGRIRKGLQQSIQQPLIHRQIGGAHRPLPALVHAQSLREAIRRLFAAAIGQQDVGRTPAQAPQLRQQLLLIDPRRHAGSGGHHGAGKGAL